eukprot:5274115-Pyramimonas_sp.AAC.1
MNVSKQRGGKMTAEVARIDFRTTSHPGTIAVKPKKRHVNASPTTASPRPAVREPPKRRTVDREKP